jgi:hypothetical protein
MTFRPSFTSSSRARRYLLALAATAIVLSALLVGVTIPAYRLGLVDIENSSLVALQRSKVAAAPRIDIVFLGDSSLGSVIDAELVSQLAGRPALNLALTGAYGYGGSYNMLREVLKRHHPQVAVVVQTIDMMTRPQTAAGLFFTSEGFDFSELTPLDVMRIYLNFGVAKRAYRSLQTLHWSLPASTQLTNDYVRTSSGLEGSSVDQMIRQPLRSQTVNPSTARILGRINALCRANNITCVYAHGPIFEGYCQTDRVYIEHATQAIRQTGIAVLDGTPICVPREDLGDEIDHVAPAVKDVYTRRYFELLSAQTTGAEEFHGTGPLEPLRQGARQRLSPAARSAGG